jgi:hypothetical protein
MSSGIVALGGFVMVFVLLAAVGAGAQDSSPSGTVAIEASRWPSASA